jgi:hypothetical protein
LALMKNLLVSQELHLRDCNFLYQRSLKQRR